MMTPSMSRMSGFVNTKAVQELMRLEADSMAVLFKHYAHVRRSDLDDAVNRI